nr:MAG TPA: hypothetical protein [Bacteriophage sp.]
MTTFESKETEQYFYEISKKYGIMHVLWDRGHIVTKEDVDSLISDGSEYLNDELVSEPYEEFP